MSKWMNTFKPNSWGLDVSIILKIFVTSKSNRNSLTYQASPQKKKFCSIYEHHKYYRFLALCTPRAHFNPL